MRPVARNWLRAEGLVIGLAAIAVLTQIGTPFPVWLIVLIVIAPDLSFVGYLAGNRIGALAYNLAHSYCGPALLLAAHVVFPQIEIAFALLWIAHIGIDRAIGYGLKGAHFKETHLGPIGRS